MASYRGQFSIPPALRVVLYSCGAGEFKAGVKKLFNLGFARAGMLPADARARDVARHFMQIQSDLQPLLTRHLTVAFDLLVQCRCRSHALSITQTPVAYNFLHRTARAARELARKRKVVTPVIDEVYAVLYEGKDVRQAVQDLTARESKAED